MNDSDRDLIRNLLEQQGDLANRVHESVTALGTQVYELAGVVNREGEAMRAAAQLTNQRVDGFAAEMRERMSRLEQRFVESKAASDARLDGHSENIGDSAARVAELEAKLRIFKAVAAACFTVIVGVGGLLAWAVTTIPAATQQTAEIKAHR